MKLDHIAHCCVDLLHPMHVFAVQRLLFNCKCVEADADNYYKIASVCCMPAYLPPQFVKVDPQTNVAKVDFYTSFWKAISKKT